MNKNKIESQASIETQQEAPSLEKTEQGVSVLYKKHFLYSKYNPSKLILNIISNLTIPENSLIMVASPVLWHGLKELFAKVPDSCTIVAVEFEDALYDFAKNHIPSNCKKKFLNKVLNNKLLFINDDTNLDFFDLIQQQNFKKFIRIDFSAGVSFNKEKYDSFAKLAQSIIDQKWKNRLTLIKFGRLFSKNIFKNLPLLSNSIPLQKLYKSISKTIIVLGAGESLDNTIPVLKQNRKLFFIICVDAAFNCLLENDITPDAVIAVESQLAIEKAYIGKPSNSKVLLIADLVSRNNIPRIVNGPLSFFVSEYAKMNFFEKLEDFEILPPVIKPLGSVGLVAMQIALKLRKNMQTPIYFSGLDFSYTVGITHAKQTPSHKNNLYSCNRLKSVFNTDAAFCNGTFSVKSKDNKNMKTSKALESYALLFTDTFANEKNIFDIGTTGLELKIKKFNFEQVCSELQIQNSTKKDNLQNKKFIEQIQLYKKNKELYKDNNFNNDLRNNITLFLAQEKSELEQLKDIFINGNNSKYRNALFPLPLQINALLQEKEYLFIHFPDELSNTNMQSFFNRLRIEVDFFIKEITLALEKLL